MLRMKTGELRMTAGGASGPLADVRVADFSVHAAGPFAGLMLAEMGAQVIKVESSARLDITRRPHTMYGKPPSSFEQINANKMSVCLNLKEPRAVEACAGNWSARPNWPSRISAPE